MHLIGKNPELDIIYKDKNGVLFEVNSSFNYNSNCSCIIYINGSEIDHFNSNGRGAHTLNSNQFTYGHDCDWYNTHYKPYIFKYRIDHNKDNSLNFSKSLLEALKYINSDQIIIIGKSYGGIIASVASNSNLVKQSILVNASVSGSPLANGKLLKAYPARDLLDMTAKFLAYRTIQLDKGFTLENSNGIDIINNNKLFAFGGSINNLSPKTFSEYFMTIGSIMIERMTGLESDGMTIWDESYYSDRNIPYETMDRPHHSNTQNPQYMKRIFKKISSK